MLPTSVHVYAKARIKGFHTYIFLNGYVFRQVRVGTRTEETKERNCGVVFYALKPTPPPPTTTKKIIIIADVF